MDLGASNGRVVSGSVEAGRIHLAEHRRFPNGGISVWGRLYWDALGLWRDMLVGLQAAGREGAVDSVGIDSWVTIMVSSTSPANCSEPRCTIGTRGTRQG